MNYYLTLTHQPVRAGGPTFLLYRGKENTAGKYQRTDLQSGEEIHVATRKGRYLFLLYNDTNIWTNLNVWSWSNSLKPSPRFTVSGQQIAWIRTCITCKCRSRWSAEWFGMKPKSAVPEQRLAVKHLHNELRSTLYLVSSVSFFPGPADLNFISFLMSSKNFFIASAVILKPQETAPIKLAK